MSSVRQKQRRRETYIIFAVVLDQGQQAFNSVTPRVRVEIVVAAALAEFCARLPPLSVLKSRWRVFRVRRADPLAAAPA